MNKCKLLLFAAVFPVGNVTDTRRIWVIVIKTVIFLLKGLYRSGGCWRFSICVVLLHTSIYTTDVNVHHAAIYPLLNLSPQPFR